MEFKEKLKEYRDIVNSELEKYTIKSDCYEKILNESVEYSLLAGGKRLRPILILATYELFSKDISECMPYVVALEMIHNFSLIHDDLPGIDNDDLRHGKPTNHKAYNEATAILAGDTLLNRAYIVISGIFKNEKNQEKLTKHIQIFNELSKAVDRMIAGEYVDTEVEGKNIDIKCLEYIHKNKTGELILLPARIGGILGNASFEELNALSEYAQKIGLAFQVKDDILSEEGNQEVLGKPVGNDKLLNKCTYVSEYGLDGAKEILDNIMNDAIKSLEIFGDKSKFLEELAIYIKERNK